MSDTTVLGDVDMWDDPDDQYSHFRYALEQARPEFAEIDAAGLPQPTKSFGLLAVKDIEKVWIDSPEGYGSVDMCVLGSLKDGRWFVMEAWADTTGWGCQDGSAVRIADTRQRVVQFGMSKEYRDRMGEPE